MMIFGWFLVGLTLVAGYGWAARLLRQQTWLTVLLGLALSVGLLSLIMLWEGLLGIPFSLIGIALPYFLLMLPGWWHVKPPLPTIPVRWEKRFALLILLAICALELFNGAYWPFYRDDTIGIYQPAAQAMYQTATLVPLTGTDGLFLHRAYPVLIPLNYTYAYFASDWENEYLAKTIATLLSLACIPATYVLGKKLRGERTGWLAALVLTLTPFFSRWTSSGYVDLPMAFFYTLAAIFALRLYDDAPKPHSLIDATLAGLLVGLAAWTKNAALIGMVLLGIWLVWCWLNKRISARMVVLGMGMACLVALPWYVRNWLGAGFLIPATAWTDKAQHTLESAFVLISHPENFGAPGWLILFGVIAALPLAIRRAPAQLLLLLWTLPFFAAWWLFVSYDPRFLLLFLPLLCVLAGDLLARLWEWLGAAWQPRALILAILLTLILTAPLLLHAVEYKGAILHHPFMSDADKRGVVGRR